MTCRECAHCPTLSLSTLPCFWGVHHPQLLPRVCCMDRIVVSLTDIHWVASRVHWIAERLSAIEERVPSGSAHSPRNVPSSFCCSSQRASELYHPCSGAVMACRNVSGHDDVWGCVCARFRERKLWLFLRIRLRFSFIRSRIAKDTPRFLLNKEEHWKDFSQSIFCTNRIL